MEKADEKIWWRNDHPITVSVDHFGYNTTKIVPIKEYEQKK